MAFAKINTNDNSVQTEEQFDANLAKHKLDYPIQHAQQEESGDFEKQRAKLFPKAPEVKSPKAPKDPKPEVKPLEVKP